MKNQNIAALMGRRFAIAFFVSCLFYAVASAYVPPVKNVQIQISPADAGRFDRTFGSLARQANIAFVIEGGPLKNSLTPQQISEVRKNTALPTLLETLCKQYDYELVTGRNGSVPYNDVLVLRKKYTSAADIPGVTNGECRATLQDVERFMTLNGTVGNIAEDALRDIVSGVFNSFSPQQARQLSSGIPISALSPVQKRSLYRVAMFSYVGRSLSTLDICQRMLADADNVTLTMGSAAGKPQISVTAKDRFGQATRPLRDFLPARRGSLNFETFDNLLGKQIDPIATSTLGEAINAVKPASDASPYLTQKPLTIFNKSAANSSHLVAAMALVYGLRATRPSDTEGWHVKRSAPRSPAAITGIYPAVRNALPEPLIRSIFQTDPAPSVPSWRVWEQPNKPKRAYAVGEGCVRRIEAIFRAKANGKTNYRATVKDLGPEAQQAFAVYVMTAFLDSIANMMDNPPQYVSDFEHCYAIGREQRGNLEITLARVDPSGRVSPMVGMIMPRRQ